MAKQTIKVFLSYRFDTEETLEVVTPDGDALILKPAQFVHRVNYYLNKQADLESFCYSFGPGRQDWDEILRGQLDTCDKFVLFWCGGAGQTQSMEVEEWKKNHPDHHLNTVLVTFFGCSSTPSEFHLGARVELDKLYKQHFQRGLGEAESRDVDGDMTDALVCRCAEAIFKELCPNDDRWIPPDGLPIGYPFDYEKDIIEEFVQGRGKLLSEKRLEQGCPLQWPQVKRVDAETFVENPIPAGTTGRHRDPDRERIIVDVRSQYHRPGKAKGSTCLVLDEKRPISFLEAGPRRSICYPLKDDLRVGIVVSGGIAPGINAVISGICTRHDKYRRHHRKDGTTKRYQLQYTMYRDGFFGILNDFKIRFKPEQALEHVGAYASLGGSFISTARHDELLDSSDKSQRSKKLEYVIDRLKADGIDILYVIGGEGTMRAAHALATRARERWLSGELRKQISVIGIPKTMDNDILWVWQAFGFLSAVEKAKEFIAQLDTEAKSNPRLCIVQLFGSDSGFVVSHAALASGVCRAALIPEVGFRMARLSKHILDSLMEDYEAKDERLQQSPYGIILLAETAIPRDVENYIDEAGYPEVELNEYEKEAIRTFVGSALLNPSDVLNWPLFVRELAGESDEKAVTAREAVFDRLAEPIRQTVNSYKPAKESTDADVPKEVQSLIIKALNEIIKDKCLHGLDVLKGSQGSLSRELTHFLECMKVIDEAREMKVSEVQQVYEYLLFKVQITKSSCDNPLKRDLVTVLQALDRYALPYEARAAVNSLIERMSRKYLERIRRMEKKLVKNWIGQFQQDTKELYPELVRTYKRLFLEGAFSEHIRKRTASGDRRVHGQTPDALRSGGLKVVSAVLQHDIRHKMTAHSEYWEQFRVFVNEPRHLIRAISPSVSDVIFGQRLGMLAVDNAMAGYTDFMVSQWLTEYVLVPLDLVVMGRKRVPQNGIFWKSVLQNTGQPPNMLHGDHEDLLDSGET